MNKTNQKILFIKLVKKTIYHALKIKTFFQRNLLLFRTVGLRRY